MAVPPYSQIWAPEHSTTTPWPGWMSNTRDNDTVSPPLTCADHLTPPPIFRVTVPDSPGISRKWTVSRPRNSFLSPPGAGMLTDPIPCAGPEAMPGKLVNPHDLGSCIATPLSYVDCVCQPWTW